MGRVLIRGEAGHAIITELYPALGEPIIDEPGKGAFHETDLQLILQNHSIRTLIVCGVSTEASVSTTVREANDRGYECIPGGLRRFVFPRIPEVRNRHDQGAGRDVRLGERRRGHCRRLARLTPPGPGMRLITFTVCSIGYLAEHGPRETLRFWVHSRFQHALNLSSAGGALLSLLSARYQSLPTAIRLETPPGRDWCHQSYSRPPITPAHHASPSRWRTTSCAARYGVRI
jgi:hypothetical protein